MINTNIHPIMNHHKTINWLLFLFLKQAINKIVRIFYLFNNIYSFIETMSHIKKAKNQKNKGQTLVPMQNIIALEEIVLSASERIMKGKVNRIIIENYIRSKLLNKSIEKTLTFNAIILGVQEQMQIFDFKPSKSDKLETQDIMISQIEDQQSNFTKPSKFQQSSNSTSKMIYAVKSNTRIVLISQQQIEKNENKLPQSIVLEKIAFFGMKEQYDILKRCIQKSLFSKKQLSEIGLGSIKGILISGFGGTGKSTLLKVLERQLRQKVSFKTVQTFKLLHKYVGGAEQTIKKIFEQVKQKLPACLIFQDLHLIFNKGMKPDMQTTLAAILAQIDSIKLQQQIVVVGTYNSERQIHDDLKRSGRFQKQFNLEIPRHHQRAQILNGYLQGMSLETPLTQDEIKTVNLRMNGFNITQIQQILRDAYLQGGKQTSLKTLQHVLKNFKPRQIKQLLVQVPEVYWKQIGGYKDVKQKIIKDIEWPLKRPQKFQEMGMEAMKGILLYGPPGCSKTMMAKAIATQSKLNFIGIKGPELFSKYVGESERAIRNIFKRARACSPCVIFFDEIDALGSQRSTNTDVADRILTQLLNEMDGIEGLKQVIIVAATNRPYSLDPALLRPGRFDSLIYIGPPDLNARKQIFRIYIEKMPIKDKQEIIDVMSQQTQNYTGAELQLLCKQSVYDALTENMEDPQISLDNFKNAKRRVKNRQTKESLKKYQNFIENVTSV